MVSELVMSTKKLGRAGGFQFLVSLVTISDDLWIASFGRRTVLEKISLLNFNIINTEIGDTADIRKKP